MDTKDADRAAARDRTILYVVAAVVTVALMIWGLVAFDTPKETAAAKSKAATLTAAFQQAGLRVPSQDLIVRTLGEDGGAVCERPGSALRKATLDFQLVNGAAQVGVRPVIVERRVVQGEELILQTYCPDQLPAFREYVQGLKFANVIKD